MSLWATTSALGSIRSDTRGVRLAKRFGAAQDGGLDVDTHPILTVFTLVAIASILATLLGTIGQIALGIFAAIPGGTEGLVATIDPRSRGDDRAAPTHARLPLVGTIARTLTGRCGAKGGLVLGMKTSLSLGTSDFVATIDRRESADTLAAITIVTLGTVTRRSAGRLGCASRPLIACVSATLALGAARLTATIDGRTGRQTDTVAAIFALRAITRRLATTRCTLPDLPVGLVAELIQRTTCV